MLACPSRPTLAKDRHTCVRSALSGHLRPRRPPYHRSWCALGRACRQLCGACGWQLAHAALGTPRLHACSLHASCLQRRSGTARTATGAAAARPPCTARCMHAALAACRVDSGLVARIARRRLECCVAPSGLPMCDQRSRDGRQCSGIVARRVMAEIWMFELILMVVCRGCQSGGDIVRCRAHEQRPLRMLSSLSRGRCPMPPPPPLQGPFPWRVTSCGCGKGG